MRLTITFDVIGFDKTASSSVRPPAWNASCEIIKALALTLLFVVWKVGLLLGADAFYPSFGDPLDGQLLHSPKFFQDKVLYLLTLANHQTFEMVGIGTS